VKVLVTGGVRSGKSDHAEGLLEHEETVTYIAPAPTPDDDPDPDWAARIAAHRARRPAT
jgi:adenosylcobinamide kinase/adenosylcobinamide-phosphate guanylyltransferase